MQLYTEKPDLVGACDLDNIVYFGLFIEFTSKSPQSSSASEFESQTSIDIPGNHRIMKLLLDVFAQLLQITTNEINDNEIISNIIDVMERK